MMGSKSRRRVRAAAPRARARGGGADAGVPGGGWEERGERPARASSAVAMNAGTLPAALVLSASTPPAGPGAALTDETREDVLASQRGEREAFDRLVQRYQRDVYRLCFRYVNNHHDANDLAQEAFLKAYRAIGRFRGDSSFSTWLYRIAVNTCLNFRSARRPEGEELPESLPDRRLGAAERLESAERSRWVREAVAGLPERQRATLILKVYHDLTHEEVARVLGSSVGTVKANLFHALANLKKKLNQPGDAEGGPVRG
jgi:RNA polymerase sigma-70 factor, ECF subfamily